MELKVFERIILLNILPEHGDFVTLKLVRKMRETLSFSEKEIEQIDFVNHWQCPRCKKAGVSASVMQCPDCEVYMKPSGQVTWNDKKAANVIKDVKLGGAMTKMCSDALQRLCDEEKLGEEHFTLYEKFVEGTEE